MSHELTINANGKAEMAYIGEAPWHGLGQKLRLGATIEEWREQAGMNWLVKRSRVKFGDPMNPQIMEDQHVLFRGDTKAPLGIVSDRYKIVQPPEVLEFFRDLVADNGFSLHTAGTLFGGKRFWALASINESACIVGDDKVDGYLLLTTSCDGSFATTAKFTTVRVVCNNTLSMALSSKAKREIAVRHSTDFDHIRIKQALGIAHGVFGDFIKASRQLANTAITINQASNLTECLITESGMSTKQDLHTSKGFTTIMQLFEHGKGNEGASAWDWVNGVTEYVDHVQRASTDSHRLANSWYGKGDALKTQALEMALANC
jgi:phage/plasmid-like protein (TIGR03299 family)